MFFLKDTITSRELKGSVPCELVETAASETVAVGDCPVQDNCEPAVLIRTPSPTIRTHSIPRRIVKSPAKKVATRVSEAPSFDNKLLRIEKQKLKLVKKGIEDSEMQFLKSLHPFLRQIPPARQLEVRANLMRVLIDGATSTSPSWVYINRKASPHL